MFLLYIGGAAAFNVFIVIVVVVVVVVVAVAVFVVWSYPVKTCAGHFPILQFSAQAWFMRAGDRDLASAG